MLHFPLGFFARLGIFSHSSASCLKLRDVASIAHSYRRSIIRQSVWFAFSSKPIKLNAQDCTFRNIADGSALEEGTTGEGTRGRGRIALLFHDQLAERASSMQPCSHALRVRNFCTDDSDSLQGKEGAIAAALEVLVGSKSLSSLFAIAQSYSVDLILSGVQQPLF